MMAHKAPHKTLRHRAVTGIAAATTVAAVMAGSMMLTAAAASIRLVSVSAQGQTVLIEATEPAAYTVQQPDPTTLIVELRDTSGADATTRLQPEGLVAGLRVEQATAADGLGIARVRITLSRTATFAVKSSRNTIRVELTPGGTAPRPSSAPRAAAAATTAVTEAPAASATPAGTPTATTIERIVATRKGTSAVVTIAANGKLAPLGVTELRELPRRLILDFANVTSRAAAQTPGDGDLVRRVRVALNNNAPLVTRVVMEIADGATYTVQRNTPSERELTVLFNGPKRESTVGTRGPSVIDDAALALMGAETMTLAQAIENGAPLMPPNAVNAGEAMAALKAVPQARTNPPAVAPVAPSTRMSGGVSPLAQAQQPPPAAPPTPAPAPPAPTSPVVIGQAGQQITTGQEKKYVGHPISMDFQGMDLRAVLRTFAEISGLNMVIDPDVQGTVDIVLTDVPWDQALEVILRGNNLDYTVDGTIVRIARIETLRREQDARTQLAASAANAGALAVRTFTLSYARAEQAAPLIRGGGLLSQRGTVQIDARTNTLIITDLPARLDTVGQLLGTLDRAEPQVEIEARIITTTRDFARALGVQWGFNGRANADIGNTTNLTFPNNGSLGGRTGGVQGPGASDTRAGAHDTAGTVVDLGVPAANSAIGLALGSINGAFNLDVALSALERSGKGRILSTPRITTQNNIEAEITQGVQIPVQVEANNTVTVTFKDAALSLKVTPQITAANTVIMQITLENGSPGTPVNGIPSIDTQRAITRVQVNDGMTTVMGGVFVSREQFTQDRTPVLHRIPFLGWLFRRDDQTDTSRELLIFITPRIIKG